MIHIKHNPTAQCARWQVFEESFIEESALRKALGRSGTGSGITAHRRSLDRSTTGTSQGSNAGLYHRIRPDMAYSAFCFVVSSFACRSICSQFTAMQAAIQIAQEFLLWRDSLPQWISG